MSTLIPAQEQGKHNDLYQTFEGTTTGEAQKCFVRAYKRMLNPRVWHKLCGAMSADFKLTDGHNDPHRLAEVGDYYQIDIPGPGPVRGNGFDWVVVDAIEENLDPTGQEENIGMRLRPCSNPNGKGAEAAHFFKSISSSTFVISRTGNVVTASYHGRNEVPNVHTGNIVDNVRNAVITSGAMAGLSEAQWQTLINEFLQPEIGGMPEK